MTRILPFPLLFAAVSLFVLQPFAAGQDSTPLKSQTATANKFCPNCPAWQEKMKKKVGVEVSGIDFPFGELTVKKLETPEEDGKPKHEIELRCEYHFGTKPPFLSNIPYVNRLFKNVGISASDKDEACQGKSCSSKSCSTESCDTQSCDSESCSTKSCATTSCSTESCTTETCQGAPCDAKTCSEETCQKSWPTSSITWANRCQPSIGLAIAKTRLALTEFVPFSNPARVILARRKPARHQLATTQNHARTAAATVIAARAVLARRQRRNLRAPVARRRRTPAKPWPVLS